MFMLNTIWDFLVSYHRAVVAIIFLVFAVIFIKRYFDDIRLWLMCVWYGTPVIGKNARLARDLQLTDDGWFTSEITLCADFEMQLRRRADDPALYDKATRYLRKIQEHGRRPMGFWHWLWILVLVIAEAAMFGYVLAGYVTPGGSEALQLQGALVIGILIASVLVWMTHMMGKELHKRALVWKARTWWDEYDEKPRPKLTDAKGHVGLSDDEKDDGAPEYIQLLNRVEHNRKATPGGGFLIGTTVLLIIVLAAGAFYVRSQTQQTLLAEDAQLAERSTSTYSFGTSGLPVEVVSEQEAAADRLEDKIKGWKLKGGNAAYVLLAIVFGLIQWVGVRLGRTHSLVGRESRTRLRADEPVRQQQAVQALARADGSQDRPHRRLHALDDAGEAWSAGVFGRHSGRASRCGNQGHGAKFRRLSSAQEAERRPAQSASRTG